MPYTLLVLLSIAACSVNTPEPMHTSFAVCEEISVACHNRDVEEDGGIGEDCHVLSHTSRTEEACAARRDECLAYCQGDGGAADASGGDGG